jgi:hypothetical protein
MRQTSLFQTVKAAALYHVPIKSYSKNTHPPSFLSTQKDEDEQPIFDLLDSQIFTLTIELINTGFSCNDVTLEQDHGTTSPSIKLKSFILSNHQIEFQYNLTGPYFISGLKICVYGNGRINDVYTLQQLEFCQFFSTRNESLSNFTFN